MHHGFKNFLKSFFHIQVLFMFLMMVATQPIFILLTDVCAIFYVFWSNLCTVKQIPYIFRLWKKKKKNPCFKSFDKIISSYRGHDYASPFWPMYYGNWSFTHVEPAYLWSSSLISFHHWSLPYAGLVTYKVNNYIFDEWSI